MSLQRELSSIEGALCSLKHDLKSLGDRCAAARGPRALMVRGMLHHAARRLDAVHKILVEASEFAPDSLKLDS